MTKIIYETRGRAREYYELGCHLYRNCAHNCRYCFNYLKIPCENGIINRPPVALPPPGFLDQLTRECDGLKARGEKRTICLSFLTDPYQPVDRDTKFTRLVLQVIKQHGLRVAILTKGGMIAVRDFDILVPGEDEFGITLTLLTPELVQEWEPGAAPPLERIAVLEKARNWGFFTFVSFEPVLYPAETLVLMERVRPFCDLYRIGKLNHMRPPVPINWRNFGKDAVALLNHMKAQYYIKADLARYMEAE